MLDTWPLGGRSPPLRRVSSSTSPSSRLRTSLSTLACSSLGHSAMTRGTLTPGRRRRSCSIRRVRVSASSSKSFGFSAMTLAASMPGSRSRNLIALRSPPTRRVRMRFSALRRSCMKMSISEAFMPCPSIRFITLLRSMCVFAYTDSSSRTDTDTDEPALWRGIDTPASCRCRNDAYCGCRWANLSQLILMAEKVSPTSSLRVLGGRCLLRWSSLATDATP
mmetsp:Transcript_3882/g.8868  ORF Transcript_3882/g.8868 Transcript_3882/m.8868 type:complete len:221 (+) Transcript_3882:681-1343(+)